jgi:uncharacterized protein (TIGR02301 family)
MQKRKTVLAAAIVLALASSATAQNLLERSTEAPRYQAPREREAPPRSHAPASGTAGSPAVPGTTPPSAGGPTAGTQGAPQLKPATPNASPGQPSTPAAEAPAPPYEPQLLRLSELLGALTYLQDLCGGQSGQIWRDKMSALIDAETQDETRRERLAGAYNRGFKGYELSYRQCTPNAQVIITRFLDESGKIARDVSHRYGTS